MRPYLDAALIGRRGSHSKQCSRGSSACHAQTFVESTVLEAWCGANMEVPLRTLQQTMGQGHPSVENIMCLIGVSERRLATR